MHKKNTYQKPIFIFVKKRDKTLLQTAVPSATRAFMCAVARYKEFKSQNQSFAITKIHFLSCILLIFSNLATMRTRSLLIAEAPPTITWKHQQTSWGLVI